jgi:GT2 family glycosyltransferase
MISVVVVARNEGDRLARTVEQFAATLPRRSEIVVVDDASEDDSIARLPRDRRVVVVRGQGEGVARARNRGARRARGGVLFFSDGHMDVERGWWEPLAERAARPGVGGAAPAISSITRPDRIGHGLRFSGAGLDIDWLYRADRRPHRTPLIPWCCTAMSREVFEATGGFDEAMQAIGSVDNEMSLRLWLLGYELWVVPTVVAAHLFRRKKPFARTWGQALHNRTRLALVHFDPPRIARFARAYRNDPDFPLAIATAATGDIARRRRQLARTRQHDAEWYFQRFSTDS